MQLKSSRILHSALYCLRNLKRRSMYKQLLNPITGQNEWDTQDNQYDYHQEVANAGFGDMLHDKERNQKYFAALRKTIDRMHKEGREVHVLDIGTGTGLLSMMAVQAGADTVTACESFLPMANCAERILAANGMADKVKLIKKRSTDLELGIDMPRRANLLVAELLDTELIGEGALSIYNHAHSDLLTDDVVCIPAKANCYAQVVESPLAAQWSQMRILSNLDGEALLIPPKAMRQCKGQSGLHDVQLSQVPTELLKPIVEPQRIFEFDFTTKNARELRRVNNLTLKATQSGNTDLVLYWWDIEMDPEAEIILSCAPFNHHLDLQKYAKARKPGERLQDMVPWRDHWMQAIYHIPKPLVVTAGAEFLLSCHHDEYSWWFEATRDDPTPLSGAGPSCSCFFHWAFSRNRIGQTNQSHRNKRYLMFLEETIQPDSKVLVFGNGCLLGLAIANLGAAHVYLHDANHLSLKCMKAIAEENRLSDRVTFVSSIKELDELNCLPQITHVFAEPYFLNTIVPWDNLHFGHLLSQVQDKLSPEVRIIPDSARIMALPVQFQHLHKIRTPIDDCEGFDMRLFDKMVGSSLDTTQYNVEAQPLWEYPCYALGPPVEMLRIDLKDYQSDKEANGSVPFEQEGTCNGVALWVDWHLENSNNPKRIVSSGTVAPIVPGEVISWDMFQRQGVHFIRRPTKVQKSQGALEWGVKFKPKDGKFDFNFSVKS